MKLCQIYPSTRGVFCGKCLDCGDVVHADRGYADLDGEAFAAFYCIRCAEQRIADGAQVVTPPALEPEG